MKYAVKRTKENYKELNDTFNSLISHKLFTRSDTFYLHWPRLGPKIMYSQLQRGYKEVTLQEFKQSKNKPMTSKFKKGDKIKIPTRSRPGNSSLPALLEEIADQNWSYLTIDNAVNPESIGILGPNGERILRDMWHQDDLDPYEEFVLPEKWYLKPNNLEEHNILCNWAADITGHQEYRGYRFHQDVGFNQDGDYRTNYDNPRITFEQFSNHVLKQKQMSKKIIGYKTPYDIIESGYVKGQTLVMSDAKGWYSSQSKSGRTLPASIVETWEPVYEEDKIKIEGYEAEFSQGIVKFGCQSFTLPELKTIRRIYSNDLRGYITINHTKIEVSVIDKIIKRLES